jgi:hypothetical protein
VWCAEVHPVQGTGQVLISVGRLIGFLAQSIYFELRLVVCVFLWGGGAKQKTHTTITSFWLKEFSERIT